MVSDGLFVGFHHRVGLLLVRRHWFVDHEARGACHGSISDQVHLQRLADHVVCIHDD